ncbi:MAG: class I SAM-dependent methyltransferase [Acidimicrobiales bacterium]
MAEFLHGPAGARAGWWLEVINTGELAAADSERAIVPGAHPMFDVHSDQGRRDLFAFFAGGLPWRTASIEQESPFSVRATVESPDGGRRMLRVDVERQPPHRITLVATPPLARTDDGDRGASTTAVLTAAARASHFFWHENPVFADDLAVKLLPDEVANSTCRARFGGQAIGSQLMILARSRSAEDALFAAVERGTLQYVLLGAGLDTFAYRHADIVPGLKVYEVDRPASQQYKRERLASAGIGEPSCLTFVPVDFENQRLDQRIVAVGFNLDKPAFFAWLGVVYYLGTDAIEDTLRFIAGCAVGTDVVFDYIDSSLGHCAGVQCYRRSRGASRQQVHSARNHCPAREGRIASPA